MGLGLHSAWYTGVNYLVIAPETQWQRFVSMYRFHLWDPIYFQHGLRIELPQLGAGLKEDAIREHGYKGPHIHPGMSNWLFDRTDDYCSVAYWHQKVRDQPLPPLLSRAERLKGIPRQPWESATGQVRPTAPRP